jgi:hypothetical protein
MVILVVRAILDILEAEVLPVGKVIKELEDIAGTLVVVV